MFLISSGLSSHGSNGGSRSRPYPVTLVQNSAVSPDAAASHYSDILVDTSTVAQPAFQHHLTPHSDHTYADPRIGVFPTGMSFLFIISCA